MKYQLIFLLSLFLFSACDSTDFRASSLLGTWKGVEWEVKGQNSNRQADDVMFAFMPDRGYEASFGAQKERGNYYVKNNKLYTTAEGQIEKAVGIHMIGLDTVRLDMNRAGTPEVLVLVRE